MNDSPALRKNPRAALTALVIAVVPLASFLAFVIQPLLGKRLLPVFGGSAGTWLGTMLYFQIALLAGYSWAAWLVRRAPRTQVACTAVMGLLAAASFNLPSVHAGTEGGLGTVVWQLAISSLPAMVLLFSISPLTHGWLQRRGQEVPYYLYAFSNIGSLGALLLYPFLIETSLRTSDQAFYWHGFLVIAAAMLAVAGFLYMQAERAEPSASVTPASEPLNWSKRLVWLGLSATTCVGMLGATHHLAAEIGSSPLAWVGPFGVFLFSFTITFSGHWRAWMTRVTVGWLVISLTGFMLTKGFTSSTVNGSTASWLLSLTASGSFLGNALLHQARPAIRFERYYLFLAAGGVLGGLMSSVLIPHVFARPVEFVLASVALLIVGVLWLMRRYDSGSILITSLLVSIPVLGIGWKQIQEDEKDAKFIHTRNLYASTSLRIDETSIVLSSETTTHGSQLTSDAASRLRPTLYYAESTGVGRVLTRLQDTRPSLNIGVVGLGAGTLAAYARKSDTVDFWDIDPAIIQIAQNRFSFIKDSPGKINIHQRDGRIGINAVSTDYDVIVIDAFSGDGIPAHLITREAIEVYFERLKARAGVLLIHASTRYSESKLFPVIATTARTHGYSAININTDISEPAKNYDWDPTRTQYVVICQPQQVPTITGWFQAEEDNGRVQHEVSVHDSPHLYFDLIWTDERNAAIDGFDLGVFLRDN